MVEYSLYCFDSTINTIKKIYKDMFYTTGSFALDKDEIGWSKYDYEKMVLDEMIYFTVVGFD